MRGVEIYINRGDQESNKRVFDQLAQDREKIESVFGEGLSWERMDDNVTCRIKWQLDGVSVSNEDDWSKMNEFMVDGLIRMKDAFGPYIQKLRG